jgi:gluconate:H+ symporter, GntP family
VIDDPFTVLLIGIAFVVVTIVGLRIHAFLALMFAAILVGLLSGVVLDPESALHPSVQVLRQTATEFGRTAGDIGLVIVLASIIGKCMMDSGAADAITRRFLRLLGREHASAALLGSGYLLSIPVFFDTVFYLLVPLAKALRVRTGRDYAVYVMSICVGAGLTHSLVAPTPGPLIMAGNLHLDLGASILAGLVASLLPAVLVGWFFCRWWAARLDIPFRETPDLPQAELRAIAEKPDAELPGFLVSLLPILLPVLLISGATVTSTLSDASLAAGGPGLNPTWLAWAQFLGDRNAALIIAMFAAMALLLRQKATTLAGLARSFEPAVASASVIILITAAGGAFGAMIRLIGIGDAIRAQVGASATGTVLILLAFGISSLMKISQGSTTVAVITASAIMFGVIEGLPLPYHPIYLFLAIGFGGMVFSWMNDSGFWIVGRMAGFNERETLKTWSLGFGLAGVVGLAQVLLFSQFLPFVSNP